MEPFFAVAGHWRNARVLFFLFQVPERSIEYEAAHSKNSDWLLDGNFPQGWTVKRSVWNYLSHEIKSSLFLFHVFCWFWWYLKKKQPVEKDSFKSIHWKPMQNQLFDPKKGVTSLLPFFYLVPFWWWDLAQLHVESRWFSLFFWGFAGGNPAPSWVASHVKKDWY